MDWLLFLFKKPMARFCFLIVSHDCFVLFLPYGTCLSPFPTNHQEENIEVRLERVSQTLKYHRE